MRNDELKLKRLTAMAETTGDPTDRNEIRAKLETARFEELMYGERQKRVLLRMMLYVLVGILLALTLQPVVPYLASRVGENRRGIAMQRASDVTPLDLSVRRHLP